MQLTPTIYHTENCLFIIDASVTWSSPTTAFNDIYSPSNGTFPRLSSYFDEITGRFPATYFSICYIANTGAANVPNYIDRIYKATGISAGIGSAGLGSSGDPHTPQSFASVDMCRYNLPGGNVFAPVLAVFDHEIGHAWGAQIFYTLNQPSLANGHWLGNSTVDCQLGSGVSHDGYVSVDKIYGDPTNGFRWQRVDNIRNNEQQVFAEQTLYLLGVSPHFPTSYVLHNPVYQADHSVTADSVDTFDHAAAVATYGVRNPDYTTAPRHFKLGFVYVARDLAEVNTVYQAVEDSIRDFCEGEAQTSAFRMQTPFLVDTRYRASVDAHLADLDGNLSPSLAVADTYVTSTDGTASITFTASDPDGATPAVCLVPASPQCTVNGNTVSVAGLPDGVHFFTLRALDGGGKKAFGHFVVEVHRPASATTIATQPTTQTVLAGTSATFSVAAVGSAHPTYQWYLQPARTSSWLPLAEGGGYGGTQAATLTVTGAPARDGDQYLCMVDGAVTSGSASLFVTETAPVIASQPPDKNALLGGAASFRVIAGDPATTYGYFHYQWQRQPANTSGWTDLTTDSHYANVASDQLTVYGATAGMDGDQFRCLVSNTSGTTTSLPAILHTGTAPAISAQPVSVSVLAGEDASFSVGVTGSAPFNYQWFRFSTPIAQTSTLTLTNVQPSDAAVYGVAVTNAFGTAYSNYAGLTVTTAVPTISVQPVSQTTATGAGAFFTVLASGAPSPGYQWQRWEGAGWQDIHDTAEWTGTATHTLTFAGAVSALNGSQFRCVVTNSLGSLASNAAVLTVRAARGDFNGDGKSDILWRHAIGGNIVFWLMNGTTPQTVAEVTPVSTDWIIAGTGDFNNDGQTDIVWRHTTAGNIVFWLMNGHVPQTAAEVTPVSTNWVITGTGDFDGDGQTDIVWRHKTGGNVVFWFMNGTSPGSAVEITPVPTDWVITATGDFNNDGKTDIVWRHSTGGNIVFWMMNGSSVQSSAEVTPVSTAWTISTTGDFNNDGHTDIVWRHKTGGNVVFWLMNGTSVQGVAEVTPVSTDWMMMP
ncbi:MAG TPA: FG-GAP-like repeat-containing protein [Lacunisphaera sp.]|nr:FG-GAP-like repeat-containing protein [Lacunisphaera sp.]